MLSCQAEVRGFRAERRGSGPWSPAPCKLLQTVHGVVHTLHMLCVCAAGGPVVPEHVHVLLQPRVLRHQALPQQGLEGQSWPC